ncbi:unnamed protein product [Closterium sp. Naga37s-1]|nr:unnamed protein product [Closterium sp. Naga37s-1]
MDWLSLQQPADIIAIEWALTALSCPHTLTQPCCYAMSALLPTWPPSQLPLPSLPHPADIIAIKWVGACYHTTTLTARITPHGVVLCCVMRVAGAHPFFAPTCRPAERGRQSAGDEMKALRQESLTHCIFLRAHVSSLPYHSFQEIVPLSTGSVLGMDSEEAVGQWEALVRRQLNTAAAKAAKKADAKAAGSAATRDSSKAAEPVEGLVDGAEQAVTEGGSRAGDDETSSVSSSSGVAGKATPPPSLTSSSSLSFHTSSFRLPSSASDASKGSLDDSATATAASMSPADSSAAAPATAEWEGDALQQGEHADKAPLDKISPEDLISVPLTPAEPSFADGGYGGEGRGDVQASEGGVVGKVGEGEGGREDAAKGGEEEGRVGEIEEEWEGAEVEEAYVKVAGRQMVGVYLMVWARKGLRRHIHSVKASTVGCGLMGILGNKGENEGGEAVWEEGGEREGELRGEGENGKPHTPSFAPTSLPPTPSSLPSSQPDLTSRVPYHAPPPSHGSLPLFAPNPLPPPSPPLPHRGAFRRRGRTRPPRRSPSPPTRADATTAALPVDADEGGRDHRGAPRRRRRGRTRPPRRSPSTPTRADATTAALPVDADEGGRDHRGAPRRRRRGRTRPPRRSPSTPTRADATTAALPVDADEGGRDHRGAPRRRRRGRTRPPRRSPSTPTRADATTAALPVDADEGGRDHRGAPRRRRFPSTPTGADATTAALPVDATTAALPVDAGSRLRRRGRTRPPRRFPSTPVPVSADGGGRDHRGASRRRRFPSPPTGADATTAALPVRLSFPI